MKLKINKYALSLALLALWQLMAGQFLWLAIAFLQFHYTQGWLKKVGNLTGFRKSQKSSEKMPGSGVKL